MASIVRPEEPTRAPVAMEVVQLAPGPAQSTKVRLRSDRSFLFGTTGRQHP
jgi:hypothetical protein